MPPRGKNQTKIRLAIVSSVIQQWRYPLWRRLSTDPRLDVHVFHGSSLRSGKQVNAVDLSQLPHTELETVGLNVISSGRSAPLKYHKGIRKALAGFSPQVILCEGGSNVLTNFAVLRFANRTDTPVIWWGLGELKGRQYRGLVSRLYLNARHSQERRCSSYLGYSSQARDYFLSRGYPAERCYVRAKLSGHRGSDGQHPRGSNSCR